MDTLLENGDFKVNACGYPVEIFSVDEAVQRVKILLLTKRGSFVYDRELGADFSGILDADDLEKEAELRCREAIADQREISLGSVTAEVLENNNIRLDAEVIFGGETKTAEVELNAKLWGNFKAND